MILITGANGFIGSNLIENLNSHKYNILGVSRKNKYMLDISDNSGLVNIMSGVDAIIHTAGKAHILKKYTDSDIRDFRKINVDDTLSLARNAASYGIKKFIFLSSAKVYGEPNYLGEVFNEESRLVRGDLYVNSKIDAETGLLKIAQETKLKVIIIRIPLVYGRGVKGNLRALIEHISKGYPLPLKAANKNARSMISVNNLSNFIFACIDNPAADNQIFNVCDDDIISTASLIDELYNIFEVGNKNFYCPLWIIKLILIFSGSGKSVNKIFGDLRLDNSKAKRLLGWRPSFNFKDIAGDLLI